MGDTNVECPVAQHCASQGCDKIVTSRLACPKCVKLGLPPSYFCTQECFRANYADHNKMHKLAQQIAQARASQKSSGGGGGSSSHRKTPPDGITCDPSEDVSVRTSLPNWANAYRFSGDLRPALLSPMRSVPKTIRRPDYAVSIYSSCIRFKLWS